MVFKPEVWDMNIARHIVGETLSEQEAFAEGSAAPLQQLGLRASGASAAHPTAGETEIIWDLTDPQEENNRWRVKGAQR